MSKVKATTSWYYSTVIVHCTVPYQYTTDLATAAQYEQTERDVLDCVFTQAESLAVFGTVMLRVVVGT